MGQLLDHAGGAAATTLAADITSTGLSITLNAASNWPTGGANGPFYITINRGQSSEERVEVQSRSGTTLTVASTGKRGVDGTTAAAHSTGETVEHTFSGIEIDDLNNAAFGTPATPSAVTPGVAAAAGTSAVSAKSDHTHNIPTAAAVTSGLANAEGTAATAARSDHTHDQAALSVGSAELVAGAVIAGKIAAGGVSAAGQIAAGVVDASITAGTAAALTKTATSGAGSGSSWAHDNHVHATSVLPWGIVARQSLTVDSSGFTVSGATDMTVSFTADVTRLYKIVWHTPWQLTSTGRWLITANDGSDFHRLADVADSEGPSGVFDAAVYWEPSAGAKTLTVNVTEIVNGSTLQFIAGATFPRQFWVEDIGPR